MAQEVVLELRDEAPERPVFKIAGVAYHFALKSDLSLEQLARAKSIGEAMQSLGAEPSADDIASVARSLREVAKLATHDLPDGVLASLTDGECIAIIEAFMSTLPTTANPVAESQTSPQSSDSTTESVRSVS